MFLSAIVSSWKRDYMAKKQPTDLWGQPINFRTIAGKWCIRTDGFCAKVFIVISRVLATKNSRREPIFQHLIAIAEWGNNEELQKTEQTSKPESHLIEVKCIIIDPNPNMEN